MNGIPEDFATFHDAATTAPPLNGIVLAAFVALVIVLIAAFYVVPTVAAEPAHLQLVPAEPEPDPAPSPGWRRDHAVGTLRWHDEQGSPTARLAVWHD